MKLLINLSKASFNVLTFSSNILDELRLQADAYQNQSVLYIFRGQSAESWVVN